MLSFSEAKALATNNPLLMDKAAADADLARLVRAERAHHRNQDTLRRTITRHEQRIATQTSSPATSTPPSPGGRTPGATRSP